MNTEHVSLSLRNGTNSRQIAKINLLLYVIFIEYNVSSHLDKGRIRGKEYIV